MNIKQSIRKFGASIKRHYGKAATAVGTGVASMSANAAIDLTGVQTGITNAVQAGETVGGYVVVGVASLVVVGLIIAVVRKL